jgi:hypothetical protein
MMAGNVLGALGLDVDSLLPKAGQFVNDLAYRGGPVDAREAAEPLPMGPQTFSPSMLQPLMESLTRGRQQSGAGGRAVAGYQLPPYATPPLVPNGSGGSIADLLPMPTGRAPAGIPGQTPPYSPTPSSPQGGIDGGKFVEMLGAGVAAMKGGRPGLVGFLRGREKRRERVMKEQSLLEEQAARRQGLYLDAERIRVAREENDRVREQVKTTSRQQFMNAARQELDQATSPEDYQSRLKDLKATSSLYHVEPAELDMLPTPAEQVWTEKRTSALAKKAGDRVAQIQKEHGDDWMLEGKNWTYRLPGEGDRAFSLEELLDASGTRRRPDAPPDTPSVTLTFGTLFPGAKNHPMGNQPVPIVNGTARPDLDKATEIGSRMGWVADGPSRAARESAHRAAVDAARDRLRYEVSQGTLSRATRGRVTALGLDLEVEMDKAKRGVELERIQRARGMDLADVDDTDIALGDIAMEDEPQPPARVPSPGRGRGAGPGQGATGTGAAGQRTATRAQVQAVADRAGIAYADAKRRLEAQGVRIQ